MRALTRLIESNAKITAKDPVYLSLDEVGTYDAEIITEELLGRIDAFPTVSHAELPSEWKGCGLSCGKSSAITGQCLPIVMRASPTSS